MQHAYTETLNCLLILVIPLYSPEKPKDSTETANELASYSSENRGRKPRQMKG